MPESTLTTKTIEDFELELPNSLREFVVDELNNLNQERIHRGRPIEHYNNNDIADMMQKLYAYIERESLRLYHSNEPWAICEWIVKNIFRDPVSGEDNLKKAEKLATPVLEWQSDSFDPITNFKFKLEIARRKPGYIRETLRVADWFVADNGRKKRYTEDEILNFLRKLSMRYDKRDEHGKVIVRGVNTSSYVTKINQLKVFLQSLPEDEITGKNQQIPFTLPSYPDSFNQPIFSNEEIESIIYTAIMEEKPETVLRIALETIYGCRCGEVAEMSSEKINLSDMTISIPTEKKGRRVPQPIPKELKPLFSVQLDTTSKQNVINELKRVCRKARIKWPKGMGIHSVRRAVVTTLYSGTDLKEISIRRFMRWALEMGMGVMPRYVKTPVQITDLEVLEVHPFVKVWKDLLPFIEYIPRWDEIVSNVQLYNNTEADTI